jgi:hypothetical protein
MSSRDSDFCDQQFLWQPHIAVFAPLESVKNGPARNGTNLLNDRFHLRTLFLAERLPKLMERDVL